MKHIYGDFILRYIEGKQLLCFQDGKHLPGQIETAVFQNVEESKNKKARVCVLIGLGESDHFVKVQTGEHGSRFVEHDGARYYLEMYKELKTRPEKRAGFEVHVDLSRNA